MCPGLRLAAGDLKAEMTLGIISLPVFAHRLEN